MRFLLIEDNESLARAVQRPRKPAAGGLQRYTGSGHHGLGQRGLDRRRLLPKDWIEVFIRNEKI